MAEYFAHKNFPVLAGYSIEDAIEYLNEIEKFLHVAYEAGAEVQDIIEYREIAYNILNKYKLKLT